VLPVQLGVTPESQCDTAKVVCANRHGCLGVYATSTECRMIVCEGLDHSANTSRFSCIHTRPSHSKPVPLIGALPRYVEPAKCMGEKKCKSFQKRLWCTRQWDRVHAAGKHGDQVEFVEPADWKYCHRVDVRWRSRASGFAPVPEWSAPSQCSEQRRSINEAPRGCAIKHRMDWCRKRVEDSILDGLRKPGPSVPAERTGASTRFDSPSDRLFCWTKVMKWRDMGLLPLPPIDRWVAPPQTAAFTLTDHRRVWCREKLHDNEEALSRVPRKADVLDIKTQFSSADDQEFCKRWVPDWQRISLGSAFYVGDDYAPTSRRCKRQEGGGVRDHTNSRVQLGIFWRGNCSYSPSEEQMVEDLHHRLQSGRLDTRARTCTNIEEGATSIDVPVFWINLARNKQRATQMQQQLDALQVRHHTRVPAVSVLEVQRMMRGGEVLLQGVARIAPMSVPNEVLQQTRMQTFTQVACTLSHLRAMALASSDKSLSDEPSSVLILEDDVEMLLAPKWRISLSQIADLAPSASAIVQLHTVNPAVLASNGVNQAACEQPAFIPWQDHHWSTSAYLVSQRGMRQILGLSCFGKPTVLEAPLEADRLLFRSASNPVTVTRPFFITKGASTVQAGKNAEGKEKLDQNVNTAALSFYDRAGGKCKPPVMCSGRHQSPHPRAAG